MTLNCFRSEIGAQRKPRFDLEVQWVEAEDQNEYSRLLSQHQRSVGLMLHRWCVLLKQHWWPGSFRVERLFFSRARLLWQGGVQVHRRRSNGVPQHSRNTGKTFPHSCQRQKKGSGEKSNQSANSGELRSRVEWT